MYDLVVFVAAMLVAASGSAASPTYGASAASMTSSDPITEGWNCNSPSIVPPDRCYSGDVVAGGGGYRKQGNGTPFGDSIAVASTWATLSIPAPQFDDPSSASFIYWAGTAGNWGDPAQVGGPGSTYSAGDNFVIFRTPNTHAGRRAQAGTLTLMNDVVRPNDGGFWVAGGLIHDTTFGTWLLTAASNWPTGNQTTFTNTRFYIGESFSGYHNYTWRKIVDFEFNPTNRSAPNDYGVRWHYQGKQWAKDPADPLRWIGLVPWTNLDGSGPLRGTAPALLDFSQAGTPGIGVQLCLGFEPLDPTQGTGQVDPRVRDGFNSQYDFYCYREAEAGDHGQEAAPRRWWQRGPAGATVRRLRAQLRNRRLQLRHARRGLALDLQLR